MLGYSRDHFDLEWFPQGFYLVEQGETAEKLYLILSGEADVVQELDDGTLKVVGHVSPGNFFGEEGLAYRQPRNAHVIARQDVTCLVFSPEEPTLFAGRGEESQLTGGYGDMLAGSGDYGSATHCVDIPDYIEQKVAAMDSHRTQFPIDKDMFPLEMMRELYGKEYFVCMVPPDKLETNLISMSEIVSMR